MSNTSSRSFRSSGCLTRLLMLLLLYVLSFGPIQALYSSNRLEGPFPQALTTFYKPVNWLYEQTPLGKPMRAYDDWWKRVMKRS